MDLAALRVKIVQDPSTRKASYPNFNRLQVVRNSNYDDWSYFIDGEGEGWMYDRVSGHKDDDPESPRGQQFGVLLIPDQFAKEAVAMFPDRCERIDEATFEKFYDQRVARDVPEDEIDVKRLEEIKLKKDLGIRLTDQDNKALDPSDETERGVKPNPLKTWKSLKGKKKIRVV